MLQVQVLPGALPLRFGCRTGLAGFFVALTLAQRARANALSN